VLLPKKQANVLWHFLHLIFKYFLWSVMFGGRGGGVLGGGFCIIVMEGGVL
jgi:hypothetical protein